MNSWSARKRLLTESLEARLCLSATSFVQNDVVENEITFWTSLFLADIDGDGDLDGLSSSVNNGRLAWYENLGEGTFGKQRTIADGTDASQLSIVAGDVDGDGDLDVLASGYGGFGTVAWYENLDGQGHFGNLRTISTGVRFKAIATADVDRDGDLDVVSVALTMLAWHENDGSGMFRMHVVEDQPPMSADSVAVDDLDGDGDFDILAARSDEVVWHENLDGRGNFGGFLGISRVNNAQVIASDVNGDTMVDVVTLASIGADVVWHQNRGAGNFGDELPMAPAATSPSATMSDVDGDGDVDLVLGDYNGLAWHEHLDGQGSFGDAKMIGNETAGASVPVAGDLDNDGDQDVLSVLDVAASASQRLRWHENDGEGQFALQQMIAGTGLIGARQAVAADVDGDGDEDLVAAGSYAQQDSQIVWFKNLDGRGTYSTRREVSSGIEGVWTIQTADIDGDGDLDVLSNSYSYSNIYEAYKTSTHWIENLDGDGSFGDPRLVSERLGDPGAFITATDLDGDGDTDALTPIGQHIEWHVNKDGRGEAWETRIIRRSLSGQLNQALALDLDGDGDEDLLYASTSIVGWLENEGEAAFSDVEISANADASISAADLDDDGAPDVLIAASGAIAWYRNVDGQGTFQFAGNVDSQLPPGRSAGIDVADFDADGDLDVVAEYVDEILWYENLGELFSGSRVVSSQVNQLTSLSTADIDQDGRADILMSSLNDGRVSWYQSRVTGDSNSDGVFNSSDLVRVFQAGKYEDGVPRNATYDEGDWNGDGSFDSADLVLAFQAGNYQAAAPRAREIAAAVDCVFGHPDERGTRRGAFVA